MKLLLLFIPLILISCGGAKPPKKLYFRDVELPQELSQILENTVSDLNQSAGEEFITISGAGDKPITIKMIDANAVRGSSETIAHARYLEYHCLIEIRTDIEDVVRRQINPGSPQSVTTQQWHDGLSLVIMHELGHCYGLSHISDQYDLMNPSYSNAWDQTSITDHANRLKALAHQ